MGLSEIKSVGYVIPLADLDELERQIRLEVNILRHNWGFARVLRVCIARNGGHVEDQ